jgi:transcription initiation factor IIF auxiliary subunit
MSKKLKVKVKGTTTLTAPPDHSQFYWTIRIKDNGPIFKLIRRVKYKLHFTYPEPIRDIVNPPFSLKEHAIGAFDMNISIFFKDITNPVNSLFLIIV